MSRQKIGTKHENLSKQIINPLKSFALCAKAPEQRLFLKCLLQKRKIILQRPTQKKAVQLTIVKLHRCRGISAACKKRLHRLPGAQSADFAAAFLCSV